MRKFLPIVFFMNIAIFAAGGDTLQYSTDVDNLDDGDTFFVSKHWSPLKDSIQQIINGRLGNVNLADDAEIKQSKIDSTKNDGTDWIFNYTKDIITLDGTSRQIRGPRDISVFINDSTANSLSFVIVSDSTDTVATFHADSIVLKDTTVVEVLRGDTAFFVSFEATDFNVATLTIANLSVDSMQVSDGGKLKMGTATSNPTGTLLSMSKSGTNTVGIHMTNGNIGTTSTDGFEIAVTGSGLAQMNQHEDSDVQFINSSTEVQMVLDSDGNVGIGNYQAIDPGQKLDVIGDIGCDSITFDSTNYLSSYVKSSFLCTLGGLTTVESDTAFYTRVGNTVSLLIPGLGGTSNTTSMFMYPLPAGIVPDSYQLTLLSLVDNGAYSTTFSPTGVITHPGSDTLFFAWEGNEAGFTNSGDKGLIEGAGFIMRHMLNYNISR